MAKYRTKTIVDFYFGGIYKAVITVYPQSKWELIGETPHEYRLRNKNVIIAIAKEDFEKYFVEVKGAEK